MNATEIMSASPADTMLTQPIDLADKAAGLFVIYRLHIKRWEGTVRVPNASRQAALDAGADPEAFDGYVRLLGRWDSQRKDVKAKYMKLYTFVYKHLLPWARGEYLMVAVNYPELDAQVKKLVDEANAARDEFVNEYRRIYQIAMNTMGNWKDELESKYPLPSAIADKFDARVLPPRTLDGRSMRTMPIPINMIEDIVNDDKSLLEEQLEFAKQKILKEAIEQMEAVENSLRSGDKIFKTLSENALKAAEKIRATCNILPDPRLLAVAQEIEEKIGAFSAENFKDSPALRADGHSVAVNAQKVLKTIKAEPPIGQVTVPNMLGEVADSGMLADLLD